MAGTAPSGRVRTRCVFYVSGFDPKGASHYHRLFREESAKQAQVSGYDITVGDRARQTDGNSRWAVTASLGDIEVRTDYEFLRWDDIVRHHWPNSLLRQWSDVARTTWAYMRCGALWRMFMLSWPSLVALGGPFVLLCVVVAAAPVGFGFGYPLAKSAGFGTAGAAVAGLLTSAAAAYVSLAIDKRYSMAWMMRSYAFTARQANGGVPDLDERLQQHARTVAARMAQETDDEVLIVGHSSGAIMAASIAARALRLDARLGLRRPRLSLMTLGQCIPLLGTLPQATAFRDELKRLGEAPGLDWIDFSAPSDGCSFPLVDPLGACGVSVDNRPVDRPKLLSPRFPQMFEASDYAALKRDKFRTHFQYIMASQKPVKYDYFAITAGPLTLAERFGDEPGVVDYPDLRPFWRRPKKRPSDSKKPL